MGGHLTQFGVDRGLPHAKFHLDPSNRLATIHQRHRRQTDRQRHDSIGRTVITVLQTVAQKGYILSNRCPVLSVCDVGVLWPNGWTDQYGIWHAGRPRPWPHCVRWGLNSFSQKGAELPQFLAHICCAKWLDGSTCHLIRK